MILFLITELDLKVLRIEAVDLSEIDLTIAFRVLMLKMRR
jgi:hypothetical protein